jgi:opacity protein-like surface antigen
MIHNLKMLGLALIACFAMSAVAASAASAEPAEFYSDGAPTSLIGSGESVFTLDGGKITCEEIEYAGELAKSTSPTLELIPTKSNCTGFGSANPEIDWNGCYIAHTASVDLTVPPRLTSHVGLSCPVTTGVEDEIVITLFELGVKKCSIHIPGQISETGATLTNGEVEGSSDITVDYHITDLKYTQEAGEGIGKCANASGTKNGKLTGEVTVSGYNEESKPTSIWVK